ncbi:hypothetical protein [Alicyclobacillus sp. SO9]|uniref:hypothetical protein n=1 Tax=Alicyclobacillus sp. SO9 TaxID=2665646 RepID=UPI0018E8FACC|nr:hypothetical protein [Alicyclobacillus sp. SO9]QQE79817.1 hypothetical protein GI364_04850 [Alicyclobacillus sp. SO9]
MAETNSFFGGTATGTTDGNQAAASSTKTQQNAAKSSALNPAAVKVNKDIAVHTYGSTAAAAKAIANIEQGIGLVGPNAHTYSLGNSIRAKWAGAMGVQKYQWQEGRWTIITSFLSTDVNAKKTAEQMVSYLHTHSLPVPKGTGTVVLSESSNSPKLHTVIAWQVGKKVYRISKNEGPISVLRIAVNAH